jgi:hypothetical protein
MAHGGAFVARCTPKELAAAPSLHSLRRGTKKAGVPLAGTGHLRPILAHRRSLRDRARLPLGLGRQDPAAVRPPMNPRSRCAVFFLFPPTASLAVEGGAPSFLLAPASPLTRPRPMWHGGRRQEVYSDLEPDRPLIGKGEIRSWEGSWSRSRSVVVELIFSSSSPAKP